MKYEDFIQQKAIRDVPTGIKDASDIVMVDLNDNLKETLEETL